MNGKVRTMVSVLIAAEKEITGFAAVCADSIDENRTVVAAADVVPELDGFNAWSCARNTHQVVCHGLICDQFRGFADFFNSGFDVDASAVPAVMRFTQSTI